MRQIIYILLLALVPVTYSCISDESARNSFQQVEGIISIETENFDASFQWNEVSYYTGMGIRPDFKNEVIENHVDYIVEFSDPGAVYLHYLGNRKRNVNPVDNVFKIAIYDSDFKSVDSAYCIFPEINVPVWASIYLNKDKRMISLNVPSKGTYYLSITAEKGSGYFLDKLLLCSDSSYIPTGMGPVETKGGISEKGMRDQIILPPRWAFGVLYGGYTDHMQTLEVIDSLIAGDFPIDAYWIDSYFWDFNKGNGPKGYLDFVGDTIAFPDAKEMWDEFEKRSIKAGIWIWNLIQKDGNESVYEEFESHEYFTDTYLNKNSWHNKTGNTMTGSIDFENPEAVAFWKQKLEPFFDSGLDFLKLDNTSAIPFCKAAFEATQEFGKETEGRGFILAHLHTTYDYRHKLYPTKWTGDAKIAWTQADYPDMSQYAMGGLKENIGMVADPSKSTYEVPFLSHDAGGYNYFGSTDQSDELFARWIQFSAMNSIMMFFSTADNPTRNHPYRYSEDVQEIFRKYTHFRMKLFPYIYSYALETHLTGEKMIRGMHEEGYQYLFGNEILVAPVFENGAREKVISLPEGQWIDPETKIMYEGNSDIVIDAPLDKLPILVRNGSIIPMRNYARSVELGSNDTLSLDIYPSSKLTTFDLLEDDGISNDYLDGKFSRTVFSVEKEEEEITFTIDPVQGTYEGMKEQRSYIFNFHSKSTPKSVMVDGKTIDNWDYSQDSEVISFSVYAKKGIRMKISITE